MFAAACTCTELMDLNSYIFNQYFLLYMLNVLLKSTVTLCKLCGLLQYFLQVGTLMEWNASF